jgi:hypothetical protein
MFYYCRDRIWLNRVNGGRCERMDGSVDRVFKILLIGDEGVGKSRYPLLAVC